jgi:tetratricopeptide (TPR) repeat protein
MNNIKTLKKHRKKLLGIAQNPTIGVIMIVKNEEARLGNILSDIKDVVDEIVVVDTGSSDATVSIAQEHGAKVGYFTWCNDFSAARNASISLTTSDYLLWFDADDRLDPSEGQKLAALKKYLRPAKDRAYMLKINSATRQTGDRLSFQVRIFPNLPGLHFENRIHEQIAPSIERAGIVIESVDILIRHTGYHEINDTLAKLRRNLSILLEESTAGNVTSSQRFFIASTYFGLGEYEQCIEHIKAARALGDSQSWLKDSYSLASDSYLKLDRIEDALAELEQGVAAFPDKGLMHYLLGVACLRANKIEAAIAALARAMHLGIKVETFSIPSHIYELLPYFYGMALEKAGRLQEAAEAYKASLAVKPEGLQAIMALGMVLLQTGKIDEALLHLTTAKDMSGTVNVPLWLSLAKINSYRKSPEKAHALYLDILNETPSNLQCLAGILDTSIELDNIETFLSALEQLLLILDIPIPEAAIDSLAECADLCVKTAFRLKETGEHALAQHLAECAVRLDVSSSGAHFFLADLFAEKGDTPRMIASLETALKNGADGDEVLRRIELAGHISNTTS